METIPIQFKIAKIHYYRKDFMYFYVTVMFYKFF